MNKQLIVSVGLIENNAKFLLTRRVSHSNPIWHQRWELPGGKIEHGETPVDALEREIYEETRLNINSPRLLGVHTHLWKLPSGGIQQTFILLYHCYANESTVVLNPTENDAYVWETIQEMFVRKDLLDGIVPMISSLYK